MRRTSGAVTPAKIQPAAGLDESDVIERLKHSQHQERLARTLEAIAQFARDNDPCCGQPRDQDRFEGRMTRANEARRLEFLLDLRELTRKHGVSIGGCGCCGSPWLDESVDVSDDRSGYSETSGELKWITPSDQHDWEHHSAGIVRPKC